MGVDWQGTQVCPNATEWSEYRKMVRTGEWHGYEEVLFAIRYDVTSHMTIHLVKVFIVF